MKVLITGGAGFVGARLAEVLLEGGHRVLCCDAFDEASHNAIQEERLASLRDQERFARQDLDVTNAKALSQAVASYRPDAVMHLAGRRDLGWTETHPQECVRLHVEGAITVMEVCDQANVPQVILSSSAHVYGGSRKFPFAEDDPADRPLSVLGASLRAAELAVHAIALRSRVNTTILRLFSVYGPRQGLLRFVPRLAQAAGQRSPAPLYGDGTAGRDMIFVDDVVVGILRLLDRPAPFRILNLGSGNTTTLGQVAELVAWIADVEPNRQTGPVRNGEMPHTFADTQLIHQTVGFAATVSLEDGLRKTLAWHASRPEAFRQAEKPLG